MADFIIIDYVFDKCVGSNFNLDGVIDNKKDDENKVDIYIECSRSLVNKSILLDVKLIWFLILKIIMSFLLIMLYLMMMVYMRY